MGSFKFSHMPMKMTNEKLSHLNSLVRDLFLTLIFFKSENCFLAKQRKKKMFQIFRIEHSKTKIGPFQTNDEFTQGMAKRVENFPHLKFPGDDGLCLSRIPWSYVFGCESIQELRQWFFLGESESENRAAVEKLKSLGFVLAEFLVEEDRVIFSLSGLQVAFDGHESRCEGLIEFHDLACLLTH